VLLKSHVLAALRLFNSGLPEKAYALAYAQLAERNVTKSMGEHNLEKYVVMRDGVTVTFKNAKGEIVRNKYLKVLDFDAPYRNAFLAVQQLWIKAKSERKWRPDIVGFVDGYRWCLLN
jgi:type I restriction enzyme, R subunit